MSRRRFTSVLRWRLVLFFDNLVVVVGILKRMPKGSCSQNTFLEAFSQGSSVKLLTLLIYQCGVSRWHAARNTLLPWMGSARLPAMIQG
jgi:hypothetical protein